MKKKDVYDKYLVKAVIVLLLFAVPFVWWNMSKAAYTEKHFPSSLVDESNTSFGSANPQSGELTSAQAMREIGAELYYIQAKTGTGDYTPVPGQTLMAYKIGGSKWGYPNSVEANATNFTVTAEEAYLGKTFTNQGITDTGDVQMTLPSVAAGMKVTWLVYTGITTYDLKVELDNSDVIIGVVAGLDAGDTIDLDTPATGEYIQFIGVSDSTWWGISNGVWIDGGAS